MKWQWVSAIWEAFLKRLSRWFSIDVSIKPVVPGVINNNKDSPGKTGISEHMQTAEETTENPEMSWYEFYLR